MKFKRRLEGFPEFQSWPIGLRALVLGFRVGLKGFELGPHGASGPRRNCNSRNCPHPYLPLVSMYLHVLGSVLLPVYSLEFHTRPFLAFFQNARVLHAEAKGDRNDASAHLGVLLSIAFEASSRWLKALDSSYTSVSLH